MAGPIVGSIEHYVGTGFVSGSIQSTFISLYRFLLHASASLGISRLAYNTGSSLTGAPLIRAMNYYDETLPAGGNAFAAFRFNNATLPFDMLIQLASSDAALGAGPGGPATGSGLAQGSSQTQRAIFYSFCQRLDGVTGWNGTTLNDGNDRKGNPVWNTGSNVPTLLVPRSNSNGLAVLNKANMLMVPFTNNADQAMRFSAVADYDNFVSVVDSLNDGTYNITFFGQYTPISGTSPEIPYFGYADRAAAAWPQAAVGHGNTAGDMTISYGSGQAGVEGGIMFPQASVSGTVAVGFDRLGTVFFQNTNGQPNRSYTVPTFNEFPLNVGVYDNNDRVGLMGQCDFIREIYNVQIHDTNADGTRAVFGGSTTTAAIKVSIPWHSGTTPGTGVSQKGVQFSNP